MPRLSGHLLGLAQLGGVVTEVLRDFHAATVWPARARCLTPCGAWFEGSRGDGRRVSPVCSSRRTVCPNRGHTAPKGCPLRATLLGAPGRRSFSQVEFQRSCSWSFSISSSGVHITGRVKPSASTKRRNRVWTAALAMCRQFQLNSSSIS